MYFKIILAIFLQLVLISPSWAVFDLIVREPIKVYKSRTKSSKVVTTLQKGDMVVISPKLYGSWRRVLVTFDGKQQGAFIASKDLRLSGIQERIGEEVNIFKRNMSLGLNLAATYNFRPHQDLAILGFNDAVIDRQSGFTGFWGLQFHYPLNDFQLLQIGFQKRKVFLEGAATLYTGGDSATMEVTEDMNSLSGFVKIYHRHSSYFWMGYGAEVAQVSHVNIQPEGGFAVTYTGKLQTYIIGLAGIGWDIDLGQNFYLLPELKGAAFINSTPFTLTAEAYVSLAWIF